MVLDHTKVVYTAEDEQKFTFRQINDEDAAVELRALRKKQVLQYDVVLVQKQPVIETESYGAENIRDTKRFYPILGRDVHSGYESTCFLSEEDYKKREIGDTITMTRFIWK